MRPDCPNCPNGKGTLIWFGSIGDAFRCPTCRHEWLVTPDGQIAPIP
ncbi:hypothetical protein GCM10027589_04570 [Actinocorallia lasiicapitis]